jgi:hypothetical protein
MSVRWSADSVLSLAPDDSSRRAAATLARPVPWNGTGTAGDLVWGLCAGSGKNPYQVIVDLTGPAYKCSCPSRKFPCKHALGLLLLWSDGAVPDQADSPGYASTWLESRQERAERTTTPPSRTDPAASDTAADSQGAAGQKAESAARRAAERAQRVTDGFADLREWLRDQVRAGLAGSRTPGGRAGGANLMATRMVDAQAPGVAGALRALTGTAGDGPGRLLAEYALLHLLIRAHERLDELPEGLAATVRSRVGYPVRTEEVLARPAVADRWLVLATRELTDAAVPGRRIWLRGRATNRWAMLLTFADPNGTWQDPATARLRPGTEIPADLHYYPGQPPLRAVIGARHGDPVRAVQALPTDDGAALLAQWAAALEQDPWATTWPVLVAGTPVPSGGGQRWQLADSTGLAFPLADRDSLWTLLAVSGGHPVTVAGEWHPDGLVALTTWHGEQAVTL